MKMGTKAVMITLPAIVAGLCATAIGQQQLNRAADQQVPQISQTQTTGSAKEAILDPRALHVGGPLGGTGAPGGGGAGPVGGECQFSNVAVGPLDDLGSAASQKDADGVFPGTAFFAEAADDFVLPGVAGNDCEISQVRFWVTQSLGFDPLDSWTGLKITIYEDVGVLIGEGNPPSGDPHCPLVKGPSGFPVPQALPDRAHQACDTAGIGVVCEMKINLNQITTQAINLPCAGLVWEVLATELNQFACRLEKNRKYWIAIAPEMDFESFGQSFWMLSDIPGGTDHQAQQIFEGLGLDAWQNIAGNVGDPLPAGCAGVPPPGTHQDLAFQIIATKFVKKCPADVNGDGAINVLDLVALLLCFGQPAIPPCAAGTDINQDGATNVLDLVALLLEFGNFCPPNNDLNVTCTQVAVDPADPTCCIFDITITNKGTDLVDLFYIDLEYGTGGFLCPTVITLPAGWVAGECFNNGDVVAHRQTFLVTGPGIAGGGTLVGTATLAVNGPVSTLVSRAGEIPFTVPGGGVHCHVTDVDNLCDPLLGPHGDPDGNGVPDHSWSQPNDWRCDVVPPIAKGCQEPDNLAHGGTTLAGFSTCTPGSVAGNESAFAIVDDFNIDVNQTLGHVKWWGLYVTQGALNCDPTDPLNLAVRNFEINIYADDADGADNIPDNNDDHCPGLNLLSQIGPVTSVVNTGRFVGGLPVFEFDADLGIPLALTPGCYHISIRARMDLLDPTNDCIFGWQTAGDPPAIGNGRSFQQGDGVTCNLLVPAPWVCPIDQSLYDLAWCLSEPAGPDTPINLGNPERCLPPPAPVPLNNECAGRFPLIEPGVLWETIGATTDGPPADPIFCVTQGGGPFNDVWFNYTATCTGLAIITTCVELGGSADIDTVMVVYDGCICNPAPPFQPLGPQIACNDDDGNNPCGGAPAFQSTISVPVTAGQCYKVQLGGFAAGDFGLAATNFLAVSCVLVDKDLCIGADPIVIDGPVINNTTNDPAVFLDLAPVCQDGALDVPVVAPGVWYSVIGDGTTLTVDTCDVRTIGTDTALSVYCGPCNDLFCVGGSLDDINCPVWPDASSVTWCSAVDQEYFILVHGDGALAVGPFGLKLTSDLVLCDPPAPCEPPPSCFLEGAPGATCQAEDSSNANNINPAAFTVADDFTPVADSTLTEGCMWLVTLDGGTIHSLTVSYFLNVPVDNIPDDGPPVPLNTPPFASYSLLGGTLTQVGPNFTGTNVVGFLVQELGWAHAGALANLPLLGGQCYWIEIQDLTPTSSAFWERGLGGNLHAVQDGTGGLNGYDLADIDPQDFRFCLDIVWDLSDCAPLVPPPPPPVNDACIDRIPLVNGLLAISTVSSVTDGIATNGTGDCVVFGDPQIHNDIWFNYTAPVTGSLVVSTCPLEGTGGSAAYDTKIAVYDGCSTLMCPFAGLEIACNDDDAFNGCAATFESTVIAPIVAGNCYKVRVGGFGPGDSGAAVLSVHN